MTDRQTRVPCSDVRLPYAVGHSDGAKLLPFIGPSYSSLLSLDHTTTEPA
jgi:hypothetical protein